MRTSRGPLQSGAHPGTVPLCTPPPLPSPVFRKPPNRSPHIKIIDDFAYALTHTAFDRSGVCRLCGRCSACVGVFTRSDLQNNAALRSDCGVHCRCGCVCLSFFQIHSVNLMRSDPLPPLLRATAGGIVSSHCRVVSARPAGTVLSQGDATPEMAWPWRRGAGRAPQLVPARTS